MRYIRPDYKSDGGGVAEDLTMKTIKVAITRVLATSVRRNYHEGRPRIANSPTPLRAMA